MTTEDNYRDDSADHPSSPTPVNAEDTRYQAKPVSPWSYVGIRRRMRTMGGQLTMIGMSYVGAVILAVAAVVLRPWLFDPYIRQRQPDATPQFVERLQTMADGTTPVDAIQEYTVEQVHVALGILIDGRITDSEKIVSGKLMEYHSSTVVDRLKITAATGSANQQLRAVQLLTAVAGVNRADEALAICRYIRDQAWRRKRSKLQAAADTAVRQLMTMEQKG